VDLALVAEVLVMDGGEQVGKPRAVFEICFWGAQLEQWMALALVALEEVRTDGGFEVREQRAVAGIC
jgi:hypothetical protein